MLHNLPGKGMRLWNGTIQSVSQSVSQSVNQSIDRMQDRLPGDRVEHRLPRPPASCPVLLWPDTPILSYWPGSSAGAWTWPAVELRWTSLTRFCMPPIGDENDSNALHFQLNAKNFAEICQKIYLCCSDRLLHLLFRAFGDSCNDWKRQSKI